MDILNQQETCLVTGVAGFIGSHLAEALVARGYHVIGIDAFVDFYPRSIKERNLNSLLGMEAFQLIEADLCSATLVDLLTNVDYVFHQAAQAGVRGPVRGRAGVRRQRAAPVGQEREGGSQGSGAAADGFL